ncbi:hypothetical protein Dimus_008513 [Dionaea muscipula]
MGYMLFPYKLHFPLSESPIVGGNVCSSKITSQTKLMNANMANYKGQYNFVVHGRKPDKYVRYHRRTKIPPDFGPSTYTKRKSEVVDESRFDTVLLEKETEIMDGSPVKDDYDDPALEDNDHLIWDPDEVEAITSLFQGRIPQKPGKLNRERPLPLPLPHKLRPVGLPTVKRRVRLTPPDAASSHATLSKQLYKDPAFLINVAREIRGLPKEDNVALVLSKCCQFLRKGSLSLTIRELGRMGLPERALQTFRWAQKQPHLFPDDRILASTVEILAATHLLRFPDNNPKEFVSLASRSVLEAMTRGFIRGGSLSLALRLLRIAKKANRTLASDVYTKLILKLGKIPDKRFLAIPLLKDLAGRDDLELNQQECTAVMKVCMWLGRFEVVESVFKWYKQSGRTPTVVMYTTVIRSLYSNKNYREALALVWEMEASDCILDLTAYRVIIKLLIALNDLSRTVRYFSKLKEAGFSPPYGVYRDLVYIYLVSGRLAKCKEVCKELESAGFTLDVHLRSQLLQLERNVNSDGLVYEDS